MALRNIRRGAFAGGSFAALGALQTVAVCAAETYTLRLNQTTGPNNEMHPITLQYAVGVARRTKGRLKVDVYPSSQLASQSETIAALQNGVIDLTIQASTRLSTLFPAYQILDLPFIFKTTSAAYRVLDGPIGNELLAQLESKDMLGLAWGHDGFRQFETASRAVRLPEDLKGLRLRIQASPISVAMYNGFGAVPVTIDMSETYMALQQKVIDGLEVPLTLLVSENFGNITKYVAMSNHVLNVAVLLGSKRKIEALPPDLQKALKDEGKASRMYWESILNERIAETRKTLEGRGVTFTQIDYAAFRKAVEPVYAQLQSKIGGDLIQRISRG